MNNLNAQYPDLLAAVLRGDSLPLDWYTDPLMTELELERIFRCTWQYIGPAKELNNVGDYITGFAGNVPVVAIRNEDGLAGFVNVCRHRRHQVMQQRGCAKVMQCCYHAWTYDLAGHLKGVPRSSSEPNLNLDDYPLLPARAEALGPWVFVNLDLNAAPITSYFGNILNIITQTGLELDELQLWERSEWESHSNWKTMLENFLECYHCAVAHPSFSAAIDVRPESYQLTSHPWFLSQSGRVREAALEGKTAVEIVDVRNGLTEAQYHLLWPNFTVSINPGFPNLHIDVWIPNGPNLTKGFSETWFAPGVTRQFAERMIAFNTEVGEEDDELTDSVQMGLLSGLPVKGRFLTRAEHLVIDFQRMEVNAMCQQQKVPEFDDHNAYIEFDVVRILQESAEITSFYLKRMDGKSLPSWTAGMFLPIRVTIPGQEKPLFRTFTISNLPNKEQEICLSIKNRPEDLAVSHFLHQQGVGARIEAMSPRGTFLLDQSSERRVVLISGGVGITPMMAFANDIIEKGRASGKYLPITFIHSARNGHVHAFGKQVHALAAMHPSFNIHVRYSQPVEEDKQSITHDSTGHIDAKLISDLVQPSECDFYLCGPSGFMQATYDNLIALGADNTRIHYESFGSATVHRAQPVLDATAACKSNEAAPTLAIPVYFSKSGIQTQWCNGQGSILELAEANGLAPVFGCRSGICGTCKTHIKSGNVDYTENPIAPLDSGEVLICCSVPQDSCNPDGEQIGLVLDL